MAGSAAATEVGRGPFEDHIDHRDPSPFVVADLGKSSATGTEDSDTNCNDLKNAGTV